MPDFLWWKASEGWALIMFEYLLVNLNLITCLDWPSADWKMLAGWPPGLDWALLSAVKLWVARGEVRWESELSSDSCLVLTLPASAQLWTQTNNMIDKALPNSYITDHSMGIRHILELKYYLLQGIQLSYFNASTQLLCNANSDNFKTRLCMAWWWWWRYGWVSRI